MATWAITIFVIRLLSPDDYGLMAKAHVCIGFFAMVSELGFGAAIVQRIKISEEELRPLLGFVVLSNLVIAICLFFAAPAVAAFFSDLLLVGILRVLSVVFLLMAVYVIPQALLIRNMNFRLKSMLDFTAGILSAGTTLVLALIGYQVWSLVWGTVCMYVVLALGYNIMVKGFLVPNFSLRGIGDYISFGSYLTGSRLLWFGYSNADLVIGGRALENRVLGTYSVALNLACIPLEKVVPIINQVAFPAFSLVQGNRVAFISHFLKAVRLLSLLAFPIFWGLSLVAPELLPLILGRNWSEVIIPFQMLCLIMPLRALGTLFSPALQGLGKAKGEFQNIQLLALVMIPAFFVGVQWGLVGLCLAWIVGYALAFQIVAWRSLKIIGISRRQYIEAIKPPFLSAIFMAIGALAAKRLSQTILPSEVVLIPTILVGCGVYVFFALLIKSALYSELKELLKRA